MRTRTPVTREQILDALNSTDHDVARAAELLRALGIEVSSRTVYRRMKDYGISGRVRYEVGEAA